MYIMCVISWWSFFQGFEPRVGTLEIGILLLLLLSYMWRQLIEAYLIHIPAGLKLEVNNLMLHVQSTLVTSGRTIWK